jgi:DNA-binding CsgD family transcriptional regulator
MARVIVCAASPLLSVGIVDALRAYAPWTVEAGTVRDTADAWVVVDAEITVRGLHGAGAQLGLHASPGRLGAAVSAVLEGLSVRELPWLLDAADHEPLTARELEVFEMLGKGLTNRRIGELLGISTNTAKYHVSQILAKTGATTRAEAVHEGLRCGLIGL